MEKLKLTLVLSLFGLFPLVGNSQFSRKIIVDDKLLIEQSIDSNESQRIEIVRFSSLVNSEGKRYKTQTIAFQYHHDTLKFHDFERFVNDGRDITEQTTDSCLSIEKVSIVEVNELFGTVILDLVERCQIAFNALNREDAKMYCEILQKMVLIIDNKKLDFLIGFCSYIDLDLSSLELLFTKARHDLNYRDLYIICRSYEINKFDELSKVNFPIKTLELESEFEFHLIENLFDINDLNGLKKILPKSATIQLFDNACWVPKIPSKLFIPN